MLGAVAATIHPGRVPPQWAVVDDEGVRVKLVFPDPAGCAAQRAGPEERDGPVGSAYRRIGGLMDAADEAGEVLGVRIRENPPRWAGF